MAIALDIAVSGLKQVEQVVHPASNLGIGQLSIYFTPFFFSLSDSFTPCGGDCLHRDGEFGGSCTERLGCVPVPCSGVIAVVARLCADLAFHVTLHP